jgi:AraC-like DNA-binding protein/mannose-6-phosphate isomerase-like protein (cupin superfamily)
LRQAVITEFDPGRGVSVSTLAYEYPRGYRVPEHAHGSDQLIYAIAGVMEVSAGQSLWLIPPHFAIWIPARTAHSIRMPEAVSMRTLYIRRGLVAGLPPTCAVIHVGPLLRELIVEAVRLKWLRIRDPLQCALRDLLLSQLAIASPMPTYVTLPKDSRARAMADMVIGNPSGRQSLAAMCGSSGASVRTIQRVFRREVGSDFEFWRRQVRVMKAVELLVGGRSVKETSAALGYRQTTAFVEMFRGILGTTPGAWIQALRRLN